MKLKLDPENKGRAKKTQKKRRKSKGYRGFFWAFLLSIATWLFLAIQSKRSYVFRIPIDYSELAITYSWSGHLPDYLEVKLLDWGYNFLEYSFKKPVVLYPQSTLRRDRAEILLSSDSIMSFLGRAFPTGAIEDVSPANIITELKPKERKKIPVVQQFEVPSADGYISSPCQFTPDSIEIYSSKEQLRAIKELKVSMDITHPLDKALEMSVPVTLPEGVSSETSLIKIHAPVEPFTQLTIELPINVVGQPRDVVLYTLPSTAKVNILIPLSLYKKVKEISLSEILALGVVYPKERDTEASELALDVRLLEKPNWVKRYTIQPSRVQFIEKKTRREAPVLER